MGPLRPTYRSLLRLPPILFAASALGCATWVEPGYYGSDYGRYGHHRNYHSGYGPFYYGRPGYPVYRSRHHHDHHDHHDDGDRHDGRGHRGGRGSHWNDDSRGGHGSQWNGDSRGEYGRARGVETSRPPTRDGVGSRRSRDVRNARADDGAAVEPSSLPGRIDRRPSYGGRRGSDAQGTRRAPPASMGSGRSLRR